MKGTSWQPHIHAGGSCVLRPAMGFCQRHRGLQPDVKWQPKFGLASLRPPKQWCGTWLSAPCVQSFLATEVEWGKNARKVTAFGLVPPAAEACLYLEGKTHFQNDGLCARAAASGK